MDRHRWNSFGLFTLLALVAGALGAAPAEPQPPLKVIATTGMIADVAREVGGGHVRVTALMGEGVDPHLYKASPGDVRAMSDSDVVLYNGLHLEGRMADVIVKMAGRRTVAQVTDAIDEKLLREPPEFQGQFDPHVWFDVGLWMRVGDRIRDTFREKDPANADAYTAAAKSYAEVLAALNEYAKATIATIPEDHRVMVTAHDAFGYFGRAYGLEVKAIQGISTDSEASLKDMNALVDELVRRRIPAVFIESSVPRKTVDALVEGCKGRGHTVAIGGELFSDAMGKDGTLDGTYIGMVIHNVDTITRALGGTVPEKKPGVLGEYLAGRSEKPAGDHRR
ncbi:MAG: zinc ABC transporter substrate-binding protein [Phycisphaerae bacterium]|nr:zinc ABC transporter substrate-binding protein [Phycisphaerae bacterium]MBN8598510.1 zinc ABC transporter substrate-binding protein [Planctomycetota bacterium]